MVSENGEIGYFYVQFEQSEWFRGKLDDKTFTYDKKNHFLSKRESGCYTYIIYDDYFTASMTLTMRSKISSIVPRPSTEAYLP